jgi:hypothetical protein
MKDGLIVYLVGSSELPEDFDAKRAALAEGYAAHQVELVSSRQGFFTVDDAWHFLLTHGCSRISLMVAQTAEVSRLKPLGPAVRLCG